MELGHVAPTRFMKAGQGLVAAFAVVRVGGCEDDGDGGSGPASHRERQKKDQQISHSGLTQTPTILKISDSLVARSACEFLQSSGRFRRLTTAMPSDDP